MFRPYYKVFSLLMMLLSLMGCTLTTTQIPLSYHPLGTGNQVNAKNTLTVGEIKDVRGEDSTLIMQKAGLYGQTMSGKYVAEKPISNVLQAAISESLSADGYKIMPPGNANMTLSGELLNVDMKPVIGLFTISLQGKIQVDFKLIDNKTGNQVWSDIASGHSNIENLPILDSDNVKTAFTKATDNLIQQLENSAEFRRALNR